MRSRSANEPDAAVKNTGNSVALHLSRAIHPGSLLRGTALAIGLLAGLISGTDPVRAQRVRYRAR